MINDYENLRTAAITVLQEITVSTGRESDLIHYFVAHSEQRLEEASALQGFTPDLHDAAKLYSKIALLPKSIPELLSPNEVILASRLVTQPYRIWPIEVSSLEAALELLDPFCCCIWSANEEVAAAVDEIIRARPEPILHVSESKNDKRSVAVDMSTEKIKHHVLSLLDYRRRKHPDLEILIDALKATDNFRPIETELPKFGHLLTTPNEIALEAIGFRLQKRESLLGMDNEPYFEALRAPVFAMFEARSSVYSVDQDIAFSAGYELILTSPSILKRIRSLLKGFGRELSPEKKRHIRFVLRQMIGRSTYPFVGEESEAGGLRSDPHVQALLKLNVDDLRVYTSALAVRASSNFVPVIRLPTAVNNLHGQLIQLENTARSEGPTPRRQEKISKIARTISDKLTEGIPEWILSAIKGSPSIKLIADAPLEWMNVDGFPLVLRSEVSRIPTTPGNIFFWHSVVASPVRLTLANFEEILVIRTLTKEDPLRNILKTSIDVIRSGFEGKMNITFIDVNNEAQLIDAFETFSGALAIFDGHGRHSNSEDIGTLFLSEGSLNAWDLRKRVRLPPIMVLGACDTHPMSASHVTTANGFLASGVQAVVATSLPIDARSSSLFIARLLLRIDQVLRIHFRNSELPYRWSSLVSGMQKRQYMTDVIFALSKPLGIKASQELLLTASLRSGVKIDMGDPTWLETLIEVLAEASSKSTEFVSNLLKTQAYLTDSLIHVQLGNPESIFIHKE